MGSQMKCVYWFKRDLRLHDNRGLARAYEESDRLAAVYVFDRRLLEDMAPNVAYLSFLVSAVGYLSERAEVALHYGEVEDVFDLILGKYKFGAVYTAAPLSWSEELVAERVKEVCRRHGAKYVEVQDNVLSASYFRHPLTSFSAYYRSWLRSLDASQVPAVPNRKFVRVDGLKLEEAIQRVGLKPLALEQARVDWGRKRLDSFDFTRYGELRDYPYVDGTSRLSHFMNLGVLSVREVYSRAVNYSREYVRQLAWREYCLAMWRNYPWINRLELKQYMRDFEWEDNEHYIRCLADGKTGYPIVDAGMRQLAREGWVHNRVRLIIASFLVKDLHVDWRVGVRLFKDRLLDYDEVLNVCNWQWAASVGVDPLPARMLNPIRQAERYDPLCLYIKRYIPELEGEDCRALHDPLAHKIRGYYEPIVNHYEATRRFSERVRRAITRWKGGSS